MSHSLGKGVKYSSSECNTSIHEAMSNLSLDKSDESYYTCMGPGLPPDKESRTSTLEKNVMRNPCVVPIKHSSGKPPPQVSY